MNIAVMALQGAFIEHEAMLRRLGADCFEVRQASDWDRPKDGLILPGGESTVQMRLLKDLGLLEAVRRDILGGLPVLGTCAGMILLSEGHLATMQTRVRRNAYGRQLGSFHTEDRVEGIGENVPMTFIRAPYIEETLSEACQAIARVDGNIVAAREGKQIATAFHPELDGDTRIHEAFLALVSK